MSLQLHIEKLKGFIDYKAWSMTVRAYLESEDSWKVVENGPEHNKASLLKDKRGKFIILCLIETRFFEFIENISTARDLWNHLEYMH